MTFRGEKESALLRMTRVKSQLAQLAAALRTYPAAVLLCRGVNRRRNPDMRPGGLDAHLPMVDWRTLRVQRPPMTIGDAIRANGTLVSTR